MSKQDLERNTRRIKRLSLMAAILIVVIGGLFGLYRLNRSKQTVPDEQRISIARDAFESEDYENVVKMLERTANPETILAEIQDDPELLQMYVTARQSLPLPRAKHLQRTIGPLQRIVDLEHDNAQARKDLLSRMIVLGKEKKAIVLAKQLTKRHPDDAELHRQIGNANLSLGKSYDALDAFTKATEIEPLDVRSHAGALHLLQDAQADLEPFTTQAIQIYEQYPGDPRAELIRALAHLSNEEYKSARDVLKKAALRAPVEEEFVPFMVHWLDQADLYPLSLDYLKRLPPQKINSFIAREAVYRAYEAGQYLTVLERLKNVDVSLANTDLVAAWALSCHEVDDDKECTRLIGNLSQRSDSTAKAWAKLLPLLIKDDTNPGGLIDSLTSVIESSKMSSDSRPLSEHPYVMQILGEARLAVGDQAAAISAFERAATMRRSWARPHMFLAQALLDQGDAAAAAVSAQAALIRLPNARTNLLYAAALIASADPADPDQVQQAVEFVDHITGDKPDNASLKAQTISLLATAGQTADASQRFNKLLTDPTTPPQTITTLSQINQEHRLGFDEELRQRLNNSDATSPAGIIARATALAREGRVADGRALIEQAIPDPPTRDWQIALGQYLIEFDADKAAAFWSKLADQYTDDRDIQIAAFQIAGQELAPDSAQRMIDRLRLLAGESSMTWRIEQARLKMRGRPSDKELEAAETLLQEVVTASPRDLEAQLLLTRCLILQREYLAAETSAKAAKQIAPTHPVVRMLFGQVLHQRCNYEVSRVELTDLALDRAANKELRLQACAILFEQSAVSVVRTAIEAMRTEGDVGANGLLLLARVYATDGKTKLADALCLELLKDPGPEALDFVVRYYEQTQRPELAEQARLAMRSDKFEKADQLLFGAQSALRKGRAQEAIDLARQAVEIEPTNINRWKSAVTVALYLSNPEEALRFAKEAVESASDDPGLHSLLENRELVMLSGKDPALVPIVIAVLSSDTFRKSAIEALRLHQSHHNDPRRLASELATLTKQSPHFQALHELAGDRLLTEGMNAEAYAIAAQAMNRFGASAAAARITTFAAFRLGEWNALPNAAEAWAKRNPNDRIRADLMLAAAQSELRLHTDVLNTLSPYIKEHMGAPSGDTPLHELYTLALVRTGRLDQTWSLLRPHLDHPTTRKLALRRIANDINDQAAAKQWLSAVNKAQPNDPHSQFDLARASYAAGARLQTPEIQLVARQAIQRVLASSDGDKIDVIYLNGQIAQLLGDSKTAEQSFRKIIASAPNNVSVINNLAMLLSSQSGASQREAEQLAEKAIGLEPQDPNLYDTLAIVRMRMGKLQAASEAIDKAIRLDRENPTWHLTRADILEKMGLQDEANALRTRYGKRDNR